MLFQNGHVQNVNVGDEEAIPPDVVLALRMPVYHAVESDRSETRT